MFRAPGPNVDPYGRPMPEVTARTAADHAPAPASPAGTAPAPAARASAPVTELAALTRRACEAYDRADLVDRVEAALATLERRRTTVAVAGDFARGKSSLVNALVGFRVCPDDVERSTTTPTVVRHGPRTEVAVVERSGAGTELRRRIPFADLAAVVAPAPHRLQGAHGLDGPGGGPAAGPVPIAVEVSVPAPFLDGGLALLDCPGAGGLGAIGRMRSLAAIAGAAALVYVSDATCELGDIDLGFLSVASQLCPVVAVVLTKTDLVPAWRDVEERNRARLQAAGLGPWPQLATSALLAAHAWVEADDELAELAGVEALRTFLRDAVGARADELAERAARAELALCVEQLAEQFRSERLALDDPAGGAARQAELEAEASRLQALRDAAVRWQTTLADGFADLSADVEHDLRDRVRHISREADDVVDGGDPLDLWDTFEPWLYGAVADAVAENFALLRVRTEALVDTIGRLFQAELAAGEGDGPPVADAATAVAGVQIDAAVRLARMSAGQRAFTALRGSYGGVLMASFVSHQSAVLAALAPGAAALMGLLMGNKAVRDEADRQLAQRRSATKLAQRRYTDEVSFVVGKYSRDHLRQVQRTLRELCLGQAQAYERTSRASLEGVRRALAADAEGRAARRADVEAELQRIDGLARRITQPAAPVVDAPAPTPSTVPAGPTVAERA